MTLRPVGHLTITVFSYCLFSALRCPAQDKSEKALGKVTTADFTLPATPIIDSNSIAVNLADIGSIHFVGNEDGWFSYVFQIHERIKILNKKAFDQLATVRIGLWRNTDDAEKIDKLAASTYNLENGQVVESKLDKKDIFQDKVNKEYTEVRFALPAMREGSIIDYSYTITSKFIRFLPTWRFQSQKYPCLWSEFYVDIPQTLSYVVLKQGIHQYAVDEGSEGAASYRVGGKNNPELTVNANTIRHHWVMKNVPAFREENFLACPDNYMDKIEFQLSRTYNGEEYTEYYNNWKQATQQLLARDDFGKGLENDNSQVTECMNKALTSATDLRGQAREIYYYLCNHFTCTDFGDKYIQTTLNDVVKKRSGTVGDINLLLVAMLRKIGLQADPVVLTTREHGFNVATYPMLTRLNYVIARAVVDGQVIFLDAAHPKLGFGQLDKECYNGHARIISLKDSGSIFFEADSLREKKSTVVFITATEKGLEGTWESTLGAQESYALRERVNEKGEGEFFKNIQTQYGEDITISDSHIDSLERPEEPVKVRYTFKFNQEQGQAKIYVNPFIGEGMHENPFKSVERKYPIEMPYTSDEMYVFTIQIPDGYSVEELPKSAKASLNGQDGSYEYLIGSDAGMIQLRCRLKLNRANFGPEDYANLRNFYSMVVQKEAEMVVLKKN
ncbi:MAG TPA: DUF3857 domain-containing protein [Puia sp.]|nr:DUF3857 domain-containing protein [Puia sp.]